MRVHGSGIRPERQWMNHCSRSEYLISVIRDLLGTGFPAIYRSPVWSFVGPPAFHMNPSNWGPEVLRWRFSFRVTVINGIHVFTCSRSVRDHSSRGYISRDYCRIHARCKTWPRHRRTTDGNYKDQNVVSLHKEEWDDAKSLFHRIATLFHNHNHNHNHMSNLSLCSHLQFCWQKQI